VIRILADENVHIDIISGLRQANQEVLFVPAIGLAGHSDIDILKYAEQNNLIILTADKDFGGLIEFGTLWGRGKIILLRYRIINIARTIKNILHILNREKKIIARESSFVFVLSEAGYRLHRTGHVK
jgi:predicted nuclease of predicted toxin-antitoxin system